MKAEVVRPASRKPSASTKPSFKPAFWNSPLGMHTSASSTANFPRQNGLCHSAQSQFKDPVSMAPFDWLLQAASTVRRVVTVCMKVVIAAVAHNHEWFITNLADSHLPLRDQSGRTSVPLVLTRRIRGDSVVRGAGSFLMVVAATPAEGGD